ncbi:cupin domain-containing protein [Streptomyces sp. NPDC059340]|uniref:cupin domain-containing protein n=1 Tax=Streptomyces sp. NPDC059340 TaxID=3346806 RepID=UPI0036B1DB32
MSATWEPPLTETLPVEQLKVTPSGPVEGFRFPEIQGHPSAPFKASRWHLAPGELSNWDQHQVLEVWMVATGTGSVWREEQETPVQPGDVILMPSQVRHRLHNTGTNPMMLFSVWWPAPAQPVEATDAGSGNNA